MITVNDRRLPLVDSLRAIAALSIFAYHALYATGNLTSRGYGYYLNAGVPLFYAISGLLLFRPWADAIVSGRERPSVREFARHRVFRIVPAYWFALPVIAVVLGRTASVFSLKGIVVYFGFLQAYSVDTFVGGIGQAWTLTVEAAFYIFLPFCAIGLAALFGRRDSAAGRGRGLLIGVGLIALLSIGWKAAVVIHVGGDRMAAIVPMTALPAALDQFAVGMALAVLLAVAAAGEGEGTLLKSARRAPAVPLMVAIAAFGLIGAVHGIGPFGGVGFGRPQWGWGQIAEHELKAVVAAGLVLAGIAAAPGVGLVGRSLAAGWLRWTGKVSYGLYLWHLAVLTVVAGCLPWALGHHGLLADPRGAGVTSSWPVVSAAVAFSLAVSLLIAWISWRGIERRFIAQSHRARGGTLK